MLITTSIVSFLGELLMWSYDIYRVTCVRVFISSNKVTGDCSNKMYDRHKLSRMEFMLYAQLFYTYLLLIPTSVANVLLIIYGISLLRFFNNIYSIPYRVYLARHVKKVFHLVIQVYTV